MHPYQCWDASLVFFLQNRSISRNLMTYCDQKKKHKKSRWPQANIYTIYLSPCASLKFINCFIHTGCMKITFTILRMNNILKIWDIKTCTFISHIRVKRSRMRQYQFVAIKKDEGLPREIHFIHIYFSVVGTWLTNLQIRWPWARNVEYPMASRECYGYNIMGTWMVFRFP